MGTTAVLVVDMQNVYLEGQKWACPSIASAAANIRRVCRAMRGEGPIVLTRFMPAPDPAGVWRDYNRINAAVNADVWLNELTDDMKALAEEVGAPVFDKPWYSAWKSEAVRAALADADAVAVAGVVADCCVLSTVFDLIDAGKYVVYLRDAVAGVSAETEEATETVLRGLAYVHLRIETAEAFLRARRSGLCATSPTSP